MLEMQPSPDVLGSGFSSDPIVDDAAWTVCQRLAVEFPAVSQTQIGGLMRLALASTAGATVQGFRVVLAERATRARLFALAQG
jgi:hypothetical protein